MFYEKCKSGILSNKPIISLIDKPKTNLSITNHSLMGAKLKSMLEKYSELRSNPLSKSNNINKIDTNNIVCNEHLGAFISAEKEYIFNTEKGLLPEAAGFLLLIIMMKV